MNIILLGINLLHLMLIKCQYVLLEIINLKVGMIRWVIKENYQMIAITIRVLVNII